MNKTPLEYDECVAFTEYLELRHLTFSHIPAETYTKSWGAKVRNKMQGVRRGVPDYIIIIKNKLIFIEMKRIKRSTISEEQQIWCDKLNGCSGVNSYICKGAGEAIKVVESYV